MLPHPLTNFEIQYYRNKPKFKGDYSKNNLPKIKDGGICNKSWCIQINRNSLYANGDNVTYLDSFGGEHIPKDIKKFVGNKNMKTKIYWIQANDSILYGYF